MGRGLSRYMCMCSECKGKTSPPKGRLYPVGNEWLKDKLCTPAWERVRPDMAWASFCPAPGSEGKKEKIIDLGRALDCNLMSKWAIYPPVRSPLERWPSINPSSELPLDELFYQWANLADYRGIWEEWAARAWVWASNALSPPVSPSRPNLGPIGASYSWKHVPSDGLSLNSAPAYQVLGGNPPATGHGLFCPPSPWWRRMASGTSARLFSAAGQRVSTPNPMGWECGEWCIGPGWTVIAPLPLWLFIAYEVWKMPPPSSNTGEAKLTYRCNRRATMLGISPLLPKGITC